MLKKYAAIIFFISAASLVFTGCERQVERGEQKVFAEQGVAGELPEAEPAEPQAPPEPPAFENYVELGDLSAVRQRGVLRLLAPRGPEDEELPRNGLPSSEWREMAEKFARSRGLEPQWVYVESFAHLVPALLQGEGDVIATNFSRTDQRAEKVAFTRPLQYVRELLVTRSDAKEDSNGGAAPLQVAVRRGSAFAQTLAAERYRDRYAITYLEGPVEHADLLSAVVSGAYPATVVDSNLASALLPSYPELVATTELESQRAIAWAVRRQAPELKRALNEFFTAEHLLAGQQEQRPLRDWEAIQKSRTLRVLTRNHPASYFIWRGELMGFDYDLLKQFAREHKLRLSMVVPGPDADLAEALNSGMGDLVAASLTVTDARRAQGMVFSRSYLKVTEQLIAAKTQEPAVDNIPLAGLLAGQTVAVNPLSSFYDHLTALQQDQAEPTDIANIVPVEGATTEQLIDAVAVGKYRYTVADSHLVAIERTYRDDFSVVGELPGERDIAWAVRPDQPELLKRLNTFLKKHHRDLFFNVTYNKYFKEEKRIRRLQANRLRTIDQLSPYDPIVRKLADQENRDWRMVVSQMYQESQFNPRAQSFAGARGLMQVLPRTARQMGISNLFEPENGIRAGVSYLGWLEERFPRDLPFDQKIYFTLAAYNAGHGHVRDARNLAARLGKNPDLWFGNVEEAMLMLSDPEYYRQARFGYVRGREPVNYVRDIRERYLGYLAVARQDQKVSERL